MGLTLKINIFLQNLTKIFIWLTDYMLRDQNVMLLTYQSKM